MSQQGVSILQVKPLPDPFNSFRGKSVRSWCDGSWDRSSMVNLSLIPSNHSVVRTFAHGAMGRRIDPSWCISGCSLQTTSKLKLG